VTIYKPTFERLLRLAEVQNATGLRKTSIYAAMARPTLEGGGFPRPTKIGRVSAWAESEVLGWIEARKAERGI
jgi:predicted DNA-binding transcriptional regulator AlpA